MLKAIETVYNGYWFRSRLEARWAVFFDTLGIKYEYEKEGYDLDGIWYLPDFWLPDLEYWVEIKGDEPTQIEMEKAWRLAWHSRKSVIIFSGQIERPKLAITYYLCSHGDLQCGHASFAECPQCHIVGIMIGPEALESLPCTCWANTLDAMIADHDFRHKCLDIMNEAIKSPRLISAYTAGQQARFEHH